MKLLWQTLKKSFAFSLVFQNYSYGDSNHDTLFKVGKLINKCVYTFCRRSRSKSTATPCPWATSLARSPSTAVVRRRGSARPATTWPSTASTCPSSGPASRLCLRVSCLRPFWRPTGSCSSTRRRTKNLAKTKKSLKKNWDSFRWKLHSLQNVGFNLKSNYISRHVVLVN